MIIDPAAISFAQNTFLQHINSAFGIVTHYALNLLYLFTVLEIVVFGLMWAVKQNVEWGELLWKILKIGLIFFVIQNYAWFLETIVKSFAQVGGAVANVKNLSKLIFNPALLWQYGYDLSLGLLQAATLGNSIGLILIQSFLGMGLLLIFGLLGIQIVVQIVGFYLVALTGLILAPFGIFVPSANMFENVVRNVFRAGVRVMVLIMVIGVGVAILGAYEPIEVSADKMNISQPLGLFFVALLLLCLAWRLPQLAAEVVGNMRLRFGENHGAVVGGSGVVSVAPSPQVLAGTNAATTAAMQAATSIEGRGGGSFAGGAGAVSTVAQAAQVAVAPGASLATSPTAARGNGRGGSDLVDAAGRGAPSISGDSLKRLEKVLQKVLAEQKK
jgi:P-type conjugative transfer protein TrbL